MCEWEFSVLVTDALFTGLRGVKATVVLIHKVHIYSPLLLLVIITH